MTKEALKLALEAMGLAKHSHGVLLLSDPPQEAWKTYQVDAALSKAITAIKEALAQPEQEPTTKAGELRAMKTELWKQPEHEPVAWEQFYPDMGKPQLTPPQRTWVGLTDIDYAGLPLEQVGLVRWAEAKLKEKNT